MRGRSVPDFERVYIDGYDMSGYVNDCGERGVEFGVAGDDKPAKTDAIKGVIPTKPTWTFGPINGLFDNTATSGIHVLANAAQGTRRNIMHLRGVQAAPAIGDDAFCAPMLQKKYAAVGSEIVTATLEFAYDATNTLIFANPFGVVLHTLTSETGANAANLTSANEGAATTKGGWLMYQIYSITGAGTVTISVDDSATGGAGSWSALSGATSGAIATASAPTSGVVQLANTATVRQYLRWQLALGGSASACVFALAFMRGRG